MWRAWRAMIAWCAHAAGRCPGRACSSSAPAVIGASGLRSSCASIARKSSLRRSATRSASVELAELLAFARQASNAARSSRSSIVLIDCARLPTSSLPPTGARSPSSPLPTKRLANTRSRSRSRVISWASLAPTSVTAPNRIAASSAIDRYCGHELGERCRRVGTAAHAKPQRLEDRRHRHHRRCGRCRGPAARPAPIRASSRRPAAGPPARPCRTARLPATRCANSASAPAPPARSDRCADVNTARQRVPPPVRRATSAVARR